MSQDVKSLIDRYEDAADLLKDTLRDVPEDALDLHPAPGKWSIRQLAYHLADTEIVASVRLRTIAAEPGGTLKPFNQDLWAERLHYELLPVQAAAALFAELRRYNATMFRALPPPAWQQTAIHEEAGTVQLFSYTEKFCNHAAHHIQQIRDLVARFTAAARA